MTFRMKLYGGSPYRVVGISDELVALRGAEAPGTRAPDGTEPHLGWFELRTTDDAPRTFRCHLALAPNLAESTTEGEGAVEHLGVVTLRDAAEPNEPDGPGAVLYTEDALAPEPDARPDPRELFGPCLLLVAVGGMRRGLHGAYLMLGAPDGTRDRVTAGELPEPKQFRFGAFVGEAHRFSSASPIPFLVRAGLITAIVDMGTRVPLTRPELL
ncbi:MAG: hypothetical protein FJ096_03805 [Deltaproteobacteria bacterium]|nr:hypothetical protein [Deltaproteobacteria bacterium]